VARSVVAGAAGLALAGLLLWLVFCRLHPSIVALGLGLPTLCALIAGWPVGLLDTRRPALTACVACLLLAGGFAGAAAGLGGMSGDDTGFGLVVAAGIVACPCAAFGAQVAAVARRRAPVAVPLGSVCLAVAFVALYVLPERAHQRDVQAFLATQMGEVRALVSRDLVDVPETGLAWEHRLLGGFLRGVRLETSWSLGPEEAAPGKADLSIGVNYVSSGGSLDDRVFEVAFAYEPSVEREMASAAEALALLAAVGVHEPAEPLARIATGAWSALWRDGRPRYEVVVEPKGRVRASRQFQAYLLD